ncbi:YdeI/OmpD-associated family protein [Lacticaseibacillus sp. GG6-2]
MADFHQLYLTRFHNIAMPARLAAQLNITTFSTTPTATVDLRVMIAKDLKALAAQIKTLASDRLLAKTGHAYLLYPNRFSKSAVLKTLSPDKTTGQIDHTGLKYLRTVAFDDAKNLVDICWLAQDDYAQRIPELKARLHHTAPQHDAHFAQLSADQQRDWARYIYSAKRPVTQNSHFEQLIIVLASGLKTLNDYKGRF